MKEEIKKAIDNATKKFVDQGKLIEAGWVSMEISVLPLNASDIQRHEMRKAFFAGAQHLYASIMGMLDEGSTETPNDLRRMELIDKELREFVKELRSEVSDA